MCNSIKLYPNVDKVTVMNSWGLSPLIEIRSVNPEDTKGL